ncbi:MAG TPA: pirin-like C-terminal cupin domain-containing protein, partial [Bacteroidia bacterium]|nr:pirin-like C-terminal cupin domain-containing protein [Bacteroidia bacterium]
KIGAKLMINLPENFNTGILIVEGKVKVNDSEDAPTDNFVLFKNDGETITIEALEDSIFLVLSGEPINEPIVPYGPFLMNTKEEILQAYDDLNKGKFGHLED